MRLGDIIRILDGIAPPEMACLDDKIGLQIGDLDKDVRSVIVTVDATPRVVGCATSKSADLIVSHHPLIFTPLPTVRLDRYPQDIVYSLVNAGISLFTMHTNFDCADGGINDVLAERLGLEDTRILIPVGGGKLFKLAVYVPNEAVDSVMNAISEAGAGHIGNYSHCTFRTPGTGTFKPLEGAQPYVGHVGEVEQVAEFRLETIVPEDRLHSVLSAMLEAHPYEEVAYDVYPLWNNAKEWGLGRYGKLRTPSTFGEFREMTARVLDCRYPRISGDPGAAIETVAILGGGGGGHVSDAIAKGADVYVTGDVKHSSFLEAEAAGLNVIDAGHFPTERPGMVELAPKLRDLLSPHGITVEYQDDVTLGSK